MNTDTLVAMFDAQLRGAPEMHDAPQVAEIGPVLAAVFPHRRRCFVTYPSFSMSGPDLDRLLDDVVAYAAADDRVDQIKWKLRGHDPLPDLLSRLSRLTVPVTFLHMEKDIRPNWFVRQLAELLPSGDYVELAGASHNAWLTHRPGLGEALRRHLAR